jgi:hypothetical protein
MEYRKIQDICVFKQDKGIYPLAWVIDLARSVHIVKKSQGDPRQTKLVQTIASSPVKNDIVNTPLSSTGSVQLIAGNIANYMENLEAA